MRADPWYKYFKKFFDSFQFKTTIRNTLVITLYSMLVMFPLPIILALGINQLKNRTYRKIFQTVTYMPHFISTVVMVGLLDSAPFSWKRASRCHLRNAWN